MAANERFFRVSILLSSIKSTGIPNGSFGLRGFNTT